MKKKQNQYDWLIVTEGQSDISIYNQYLDDSNTKLLFKCISAGGKGSVMNMNWIATLKTNLGRTGFKGVILVVDSDDEALEPFANYRHDNSLPYADDTPPLPRMDKKGAFWLLDIIKGLKPIPIMGINVPRTDCGCLESDLLSAYGFPIESQTEYTSLVKIIKDATIKWKIKGEGEKPWWEENEKARFDKFIYTALRQGFKRVVKIEPKLPEMPDVVKNILTAANTTDIYQR